MIRQRPRRLHSDRRAAAALEFALVCAPFTIFFVAVFSVGLQFYLQQALDFATQGAARQVELGHVPPNYTQADFINKVFCPIFGQLRACANLYVDLRPVSDYARLTAPGAPDAPDSTSTTGFSFCSGQPGQLMYLHIVYLTPSIGGALLGTGSSGNMIVANASFANQNPGGNTVVQANGC